MKRSRTEHLGMLGEVIVSRIAARLVSSVAAAALSAALVATPAFAETPPPSAPAATTPSANVVINLIRALVKQGVLSQKQADDLMRQAQAEADQAKTAQASAAPPAPAEGTIRVPYVPETVKKQIADSVRQQVLQEVQDHNWAKPEAVPDWTKHVKVSADLRARAESDFYSQNNIGPCVDPPLPNPPPACAFDGFVDFAGFNDQGPIDINPTTNPTGLPFLNTRVDRPLRGSIRARLNVAVDVVEGVFFDMRLATGQNNGPVSTTQLFGGSWTKKDFWLDQAYLQLAPGSWGGSFTVGRMPDPFLHTELVFDDDLNFDGLALGYASPGKTGFGFGATAGVFPLEYGGSNFPSFSAFKPHDVYKWMQGGQITAGWTGNRWNAKVGLGYYDFVNVRGELSSPCALYNGNKACDTDQTRPAFMQKGNTLFLLRNIIPDPAHPTDYAQPQFVGLSFDYNILNATGQLNFAVGDDYQLALTVDYVRNLAFSPRKAYERTPLGIPINNLREGAIDLDVPTALQSGPNGVNAKFSFGHAKPSEWGEWNVAVGYRYLEPDAVLDSLTDSDFHLGGTNAKGYFVGGTLGLFHNTSISARWLSANEVFGPPLAIDVLQIDLNTGF